MDFEERIDGAVREAVGPYEKVVDFAHEHGYSQLTRVRAGHGYFWVKRHRYPGKQAGEIHALRFWGPRLGSVPELVGWSVDPAVVVLSEIAGVVLDADDLAIWREGGAWLARMHAIENDWLGGPGIDGLPQGEPETDPVAHLNRAIQTRLTDGKANGWLTPEEADFVERTAREKVLALEGDVPCAVHRDFGPRNWIARPTGGLAGVIDFEHAVWGLRCMDLGRLSAYNLDDNEEQKAAFFAGYGEASPTLAARIEAGALLHAVGGLVFANRVGDQPFVELNRRALRRMMG